jgi:hypothetical protein
MRLTSRGRLINTLKGDIPDRVPISLYEFDGFYDSWIYSYPEYAEILQYAEGKTDKMYFWSPPGEKSALFYGEVEEQDIVTTEWKEESSVYTRTVIRTPQGKLSSLSRQDQGVHTTWTIEHLCKEEKDAEKVLSLRYLPWRPSVDSFFELDRKLGDSGIIMSDIPDALCLTVELFGFSRFLTTYIDSPKVVFRLMDFFQERICDFLKFLLKSGAVTLYRIVGPEYATPPYLRPEEFDKLVTAYDRELIDLLHRSGGIARLHSHGRIGKVLESFLQMGIDATDPVEPPPDGDVELKEAREILGNEVTLIGNIEERLFHTGGKEDMEQAVRKAIEEGASGGPFILCPTAMPLTTPLDKKVRENIIHYIDSGIKYGEI